MDRLGAPSLPLLTAGAGEAPAPAPRPALPPRRPHPVDRFFQDVGKGALFVVGFLKDR